MYFFFQAEDGIRDATVTGVQTCALPISCTTAVASTPSTPGISTSISTTSGSTESMSPPTSAPSAASPTTDRKSTRLNSSHGSISYAVFCLKKKTTKQCKSTTRHSISNDT